MNTILKKVRYKSLTNWSVSHLLANQFGYNEDFKLERIGNFLLRNKTQIIVEDDTVYKRVTIRLFNKGIRVRDTEIGRNIGTKKQFIIKEGQFLMSKIDARNGAFGIAIKEVDEAIITADFLSFDIDESKIIPQFLVLLTTTKQFQKFAQSASSGTTGRQRMDEKKFLEVKIPLPNINLQKQIIEKYNEIVNHSIVLSQDIKLRQKSIYEDLSNDLGVQITSLDQQGLFQIVRYKKLNVWSVGELLKSENIKSKYQLKELKEVAHIIMGNSPSSELLNNSGIGYKFIGGAADILDKKVISTRFIENSSKISMKGDILYLIRATIGNPFISDNSYYLGRGVSAIRAKDNVILADFLLCFLKLIEDNIKKLGTGSTFKQISKPILEKIKIPIPPLEIQKIMISKINLELSKIELLNKELKKNINSEIKIFESEIFKINKSMILKKIHLHDYKLLKNIDIDLSKQISVFIGINGSGKSSVLESLSLIFSVAYEQIILNKKTEAPENIRQSYVEYLLRYETETEKEAMHSAFSIDYIPVKLLIDNNGKVKISINLDSKKEKEFCALISKKYSDEDLLPNRLIIYYSGISNHFQNIYQSTEDYLLKQLKQNPLTTKHGYVENTKMPMFLFNPTDFNLLFAGLWGFSFNDRIDNSLFNNLKVSDSPNLISIVIKKIEFDTINLKDWLKEIENDIMLIEDNDTDADLIKIRHTFNNSLKKRRVLDFFGASGRLGAFLKQLQETCLSPESAYDEIKEEYIFNFSKEKWQFLCEDVLQNPKMVFELLLMLKHNELLQNLSVNITKDNTEINGNQLSEGEKQRIIIFALNEILGINNSLFLFDEPDNFLHPSFQDDLILNIEENNSINEMMQNHYFITTHNPSFLNNLNPEEGELFILNSGKLVKHNLSWFGRDINDTVHDIMGSDFRPKWAIDEIQLVDSLLDLDNIEEGEAAFKVLKKKLSSTDIDIIRLQSKLDFIKD